MKFTVEARRSLSGECDIEAPSIEAARKWAEQEMKDRFRDWDLDGNPGEYEVDVWEQADLGQHIDVRVDEEGAPI